ncbi:tail fiber protein [Paenibacillus sp. 3LSP]|nr:tail fiber protein [Paenibacillus sp. 3LSP]MDU0332530.1 tail fiber protein [Paenibacillus sp. 3LSP]
MILVSSWSYALTNKGRQLQAKAQAGAQLVYTRMAVGSGTLSGQSLESMTALIAPVKDLDITRLKRPAGATRALIGATLTNQDVTTGFYLREVGIFADDPDDGEILYMYANSGATADYITPQGDGVIEKALNMNVFVGSAANITANIDESLVYATQQDLADAIAGIQINDATTTQKGIVQLSNATNSTAEDRAATPKAVKLAYDAAVAAQTTANAANLAAAAAQTKADAAETPAGAQAKVNAAVGSLSSLLTTAKGNTVAAINELFTNVSDGKNTVAAAITDKGVPALGSDTFAVLAQKIGQISTGIKVASGNFSPAINSNSPVGSIANLPFSPKLLILFGYVNLYSVPGPIDANVYGNLVAYNISGTLTVGDSIRGELMEPNYGQYASMNIETVNFGLSELSFTIKFTRNGSYQSGGAITKYIVFGV